MIVVQMGVDGLATDPHGIWNLTHQSYLHAIDKIVENGGKKVLVLGGGGYCHRSASIVWTMIMALLVGVQMDNDIAEHEYYGMYLPDAVFAIPKGNRIEKQAL